KTASATASTTTKAAAPTIVPTLRLPLMSLIATPLLPRRSSAAASLIGSVPVATGGREEYLDMYVHIRGAGQLATGTDVIGGPPGRRRLGSGAVVARRLRKVVLGPTPPSSSGSISRQWTR